MSPAYPDLLISKLPDWPVMVSVPLIHTQPTGTHQLGAAMSPAKRRQMPAVAAAVNLGFITQGSAVSWAFRGFPGNAAGLHQPL